MSLFEKSLQSFLTNTNGAMYSGSPAPILCIADTTPFQSTLVQQTLIHKLIGASPTTTSSTTTTTKNNKSDEGPLIIALSRPTHPLLTTLVTHPSITTLFPPTTTNAAGFITTTQWTPQTLIAAIHSAIQSKQPNPPQPQRPIAILIDSLSTTLKNYHPMQIQPLINALLTIPTVSGIILSISTDTLLPTTTSTDPTDSTAQSTLSGVDVFDNITSLATTLYQILPPPNQYPTAVISCRVSHRSSNSKITAETVPLQPHATKPGLVTCTAAIKSKDGLSSSGQNGQGSDGALPEGLQNLPFNLALTQHQMQQRAQVELPYAHQGHQPGGQGGGVNNAATKSTSSTGKMGLLSSAPIRKNANFDEVIDDDESDEDGEL